MKYASALVAACLLSGATVRGCILPGMIQSAESSVDGSEPAIIPFGRSMGGSRAAVFADLIPYGYIQDEGSEEEDISTRVPQLRLGSRAFSSPLSANEINSWAYSSPSAASLLGMNSREISDFISSIVGSDEVESVTHTVPVYMEAMEEGDAERSPLSIQETVATQLETIRGPGALDAILATQPSYPKSSEEAPSFLGTQLLNLFDLGSEPASATDELTAEEDARLL